LHRIVDHALARALAEILGEWPERVEIDRRILDRRVGEHQCRRVLPSSRVRRRVSDEVVVVVAIERVELAAVLALLRMRDGGPLTIAMVNAKPKHAISWNFELIVALLSHADRAP